MVAQETKDAVARKIGLDERVVEEVSHLLGTLLADLQTLYIKTRGFHWNLEDARFYFLHELLENHYEALEEESDVVAERMRQIGKRAPGSLKEFKNLSHLHEITGPLSGNEMIENLLGDYEHLITLMRSDITKTTNLNDYGTTDMLTQTLRAFEKRAWIYRSHLPADRF